MGLGPWVSALSVDTDQAETTGFREYSNYNRLGELQRQAASQFPHFVAVVVSASLPAQSA
jgi:hypothetical protein